MIFAQRTSCALFLCSVLALAGCVEGVPGASPSGASTGSSATQVAVARGKTAEERALEKEVRSLNEVTRNIVVSNTIQGALAGAAAGCLLARVTNRDCADGAIAGGLLGGVAGNQVGRAAAQKKRELVSADQTLAKLQGVSQRLASVEGNLRSVVARQNSEIASLRRQVSAGQVSSRAAQSRINAINSNRRAVINGLDASRANVDKEQQNLIRVEQESGQSQARLKRAVGGTSNRIQRLRNSVSLVSTS